METYVVGFKICDAKALQTEDGSPCSPFVLVECCGLQFQTQTLEDRQQIAPFNENCTWPNLELHPKQFDSASIEFKVFAKNWFTRNFLIGKASLQLSFINKRQNCLYARKWLCLRRDDDPAITGMLNVTVFALKPGQQAPSATLQEQEQLDGRHEQDGEEDLLSKAVLKTTVEAPPGKAHHLEIDIHRVQDLHTTPSLAGERYPSPYVTVEFAGCVLKTEVTENVTSCSLNTKLRIPVVTPLYEDTIILKLWNSFTFAPDELMAQGLISFSELHNNSLPPRWFNLYGWNLQEIPDMAHMTGAGIEPEPNCFKGRILVSGRVRALDEDEELQAAKVDRARNVPEPNVKQLALLADVYMVIGAEGRNCEVEVSFGAISSQTQKVAAAKEDKATSSAVALAGDGDEGSKQEELQVKTFTFKEVEGRINPMLVMTPEESISQPFVMINVYTDSWMSGRRRVGFCMRKLEEFPRYEPGNPAKPRFYPLTPMPGFPPSSSSPSVLITIETNPTEDIVRHARKLVKPMTYIVRTYCFMARKIRHCASGDKFQLRVACAGRSRETVAQPGPRAKWMKHLDLQVTLYSDSAKEPPVNEPITVTLVQPGGRHPEVGKAVCMYTHMRQKDNLGDWEPYVLAPQWIKVSGGRYGGTPVAEVLVAFELLLYKYRDEKKLQPREMCPREDYDKRTDFCRLRKATLHFSLHGLRDLKPLPRVESLGITGGCVDVCKPIVEVEVQWGDTDAAEAGKAGQQPLSEKLTFRYTDVVEGGDKRVKSDRLNNWLSVMGPSLKDKGANFEFLQVGKLKVQIPDQMILQPYVIIRVYEEPSRLGRNVTELLGYTNTLVGESRRSLAEKLPCCWLKGVVAHEGVEAQRAKIEAAFKKARDEAAVNETFTQPSDEQLKEQKKGQREGEKEERVEALKAQVRRQEEDGKEYLNSEALPEPLRVKAQRRKLTIKTDALNVQEERNFSPRVGEKAQQAGALSVAKTIQGKLESSTKPPFVNDFWFKNAPLLRNADTVEDDDAREWDFLPITYGFVKCTYKLVDGWEEYEDTAELQALPAPAAQAAIADAASPGASASTAIVLAGAGGAAPSAAMAASAEGQLARVKCSYALDEDLDKYAFDEKKLRKRFKDAEHVPSRVRVRMYLVKAVCIFGKGQGDFPDPYVEFQLGRNDRVSTRSDAKVGTNQPDFYHLEERDIVLPDDSRLEVRIMDKASALEFNGDSLIGGTIIDLEDRWHSQKWRSLYEKRDVPHENRPLISAEIPGKNRGSIDMWIEMLETQRAADLKASPLVPPPQIELEVRLVIWDAKAVKLVKEDYVNVHITTMLDCQEYFGEHHKLQETDTHFQSKDGSAVFNWRIVYPRIKMPVKTCSLKMDLFHYELMGNTFIGSLNLDLKKYVERVATNMDAVEVGPDNLHFSSPETEEQTEPEEIGSVRVQLYVLTQSEATSKKAGIGRDDPNDNPPLITPAEGRDWGTFLAGFGFTMPDLGLYKKLIPLVILMVVFLIAIIGMKQIGLL